MLASAETEPSLTLRCPRPSIQAGAMNQVLSPQSRGLLIGRLARVAFLLIPVFPAAVAEPPQASPIANFTDVAEKAGLTMTTVFGGKDSKKYIIETTGTGVAIFDYDNDGWPDIFLVNGTTLEGFPAATAPTNHLYRNNHNGTFTDVTAKAGRMATGGGREFAPETTTTTAGKIYTSPTTARTDSITTRRGCSQKWRRDPEWPARERLGERDAPSWTTIATAFSI